MADKQERTLSELFSKSEVPSLCLRDVERVNTFRKAIQKVVRPGDVVLDAGAGSGILSLFAAQSNAAKVYAVEADKALAENLRRIVAINGLSDKIEVHAGDIRSFELGQPVNVVVAEMIETWLLDELQVQALNALRANGVIDQGSRIIPARYEAFATFGFVDFNFYGFRLPFPVHDWPDLDAENGWHPLKFHQLTDKTPVFDIDFARPVNPVLKARVPMRATAQGTVNAVQLSGVVHLVDGLTLGQTVAFNGSKIIPCQTVEVRKGAMVTFLVSGTMSGGLGSLTVSSEQSEARG